MQTFPLILIHIHAHIYTYDLLHRIKGVKAVMKEATFQSSAFGKRESIETTINGRVIFDLLPYMFRNHKLSSYSLNSVSAEFLGQQKEDVHHSIISTLQMYVKGGAMFCNLKYYYYS